MIKGEVKTEKEYRALDRDSSSSLKDFAQDRRVYFKKYILRDRVEEEKTKALLTGDIVDCLLFTPESFDNKFCMSCLHKAPDATTNMGKFVNALYNYTIACTNEEGEVTRPFEDIAKDAYKESGFKWSFDAVIAKFAGTDNEIYYNELLTIKSKGLQVVTVDDMTNAERIVNDLKTNDSTCDIVNRQNSTFWSVYKQLQIEDYEIDGLPLKSMLDLVHCDHKNKIIYIYDLKVTFSVEGFVRDYFLYRLAYIQAYLYFCAVKHHFSDLIRDGYKVEFPKFIVADSIGYMEPLIYSMTQDTMDDALNGFSVGNRKYEGTRQIIENLKFAKHNDCWKISKTNYHSKGRVNITY